MLDSLNHDHLISREDEKFEALADVVAARTGLGWGARGRAALRRAVEGRLRTLSLSGPAAYLMALREDESEWGRLISQAADGDTVFFRNPVQFDALSQALLADLTLRRVERRLMLVSLGCSTGQEAYSLAMTVKESGLMNRGWDVDIYAVDLNPDAVQVARTGLYSDADLSGLSPARLQRWFRRSGGRYQVKDELRDMVRWAVFNVAGREEWPWPDIWGQVDAVLMKNVLLGLAPQAGRRAVDTLAELIGPDGILLMGLVEGLPYGLRRFVIERWAGLLYLRRRSSKLKVNPGHVPRKRLRAGTGAAEVAAGPVLGQPLSHYVSSALEQGADVLGAGDPERAFSFFESALDDMAEQGDLCAEALGLASRAHMKLGRWGEARDLADRVTNFVAEKPWAHALVAEAWSGEGDASRAHVALKRAIEMMSADAQWKNEPFFRLDPATMHIDPLKLYTQRLSQL